MLVKTLEPGAQTKKGKYKNRVKKNIMIRLRVLSKIKNMQAQVELLEKIKGYLRFEDFEETESVSESIKLDLVRCVLELLWWDQVEHRIVPLKKWIEHVVNCVVSYPFFTMELISGEELWSLGIYYTLIVEAAEMLGISHEKQEQVYEKGQKRQTFT